jgi:hypothetical protein
MNKEEKPFSMEWQKNRFRMSRNVYVALARTTNDLDELPEIDSDATEVEELDGRAGAKVSLWSKRFQYEILCEHSLCSLQLLISPLDGSGQPTIIFSGDCRQGESFLRVQAYVLVAEDYSVKNEDAIKRILLAAFGPELFKEREED